MNRSTILFVSLGIVNIFSCIGITQAQELPSNEAFLAPHVEGELLISYDEDDINLNRPLGALEAKIMAHEQNISIKETIKEQNIAVVSIDPSVGIIEAMEDISQQDGVLHVQPNYIYEVLGDTFMIPNDSLFYQQWNLYNTGQMYNYR